MFEKNKLDKLTYLNGYLQFDNTAKISLQEFHVILNKKGSLNNDEVKNWIKHYDALYEKELLSFDVEYLDHEYNTDDKIYVSESNTFVDTTPFKSIIAFCKRQSLLIGNGYHLTSGEEQLMLNDYYYQPNRNPEEHLKLIMEYLTALDES